MTLGASQSMRLDKWLWAARFFKTRSLAAEAINGGRVHLDGRRTKPGKEIRIGSRLRVHKDSFEWDIVVEALNAHRRPAAEAAALYSESEQSRQHRFDQVAAMREQRRNHGPARVGKPNKRDLRLIRRFTGVSD